MRAIGKSRRAWFDGHSDGRRIQDFTMPHVLYIRIGPGAVTVTTTGQHKRSTTKMLQIWFISNKKSQHIAIFKSDFSHYPCGSCSVPSLFGCFIQPLQSGLDGMKAATVWIVCIMSFYRLNYYCVFDENAVEETDDS